MLLTPTGSRAVGTVSESSEMVSVHALMHEKGADIGERVNIGVVEDHLVVLRLLAAGSAESLLSSESSI